jgi:hypothetical protein
MADQPASEDLDVNLTWPSASGQDDAARSPAVTTAPPTAAPRRGVRLRVGEGSGALRAELASLRAEVDALRDEVASLRRELGERPGAG